MGQDPMKEANTKRKRWYQRATIRSVALYVALLVLMETVMLITIELSLFSINTTAWFALLQPWAVIVISIIFLWVYTRSWIKQYRRPTDLLSEYLENSPTIHFELRKENDNFRVHWVSRNAERLLGYSIDEIKTPNWWYDNLHPADRAAVLKKARRGIEQTEFLYEYRFRHADGHYIWIRDQIRQDDASGKRIKGSWLNISNEFKSTDRDTDIDQEASVVVGLAELNAEHRLTHIDDSFARIIGLPLDQVTGLRLEDILTPTSDQKGGNFSVAENIAVIGRRHDYSRYKAQLFIKNCHQTKRLIACLTDITLIEQQRQALQQAAYCDELTGLPNLRSLHRNFSQLINELPDDRLATLVTININQFHQINQRYGALVGDRTLNRIAKRLKEVLPFGGKLYSAGGDEFVVLINNITEYIDVQVITNKLIAVFKQKFLINNEAQFQLNCSAGASIYPLDGYDSEQLLAQARSAMIKARDAKASNAVLFQHEVEQPSHFELQLAEDIQYALAKKQFEIYYQPVLDQDKNIVAAEALLRWRHEEHGLLTAEQFLHHAEHTETLAAIGLWGLDTAITHLGQWINDDSPIQRLAINLSVSQISAELVTEFTRQLAANPALKGRLDVELSESALNEADTSVREAIHQLSKLGIGLTIDDFGTGFSSLSYLADYPIDTVKIDRSFIQNIVTNGRTQKVVASMIKLARDVGVEVQAEGVENEAQLELLLKVGCHRWQGHLIHPAKPVDELINLD